MALMTLDKKRLRVFMSITSFETWWAYYSMSSGNVYEKEVKESFLYLLSNIRELAKLDPGILDKESIQYEEVETGFTIEDTISHLKAWAEGRKKMPFSTVMKSRVFFSFLFLSQKVYLLKNLGLKMPPTTVFSSTEFSHTERFRRWRPHLPEASMYWYDEDFNESILSTSQTIVVYGDIRRSQDLMIYTIDYERFEDMMIKFFDTTRNLINKNLGIFDKFTGDGFLAYFNEYICKKQNEDFLDCFLKFSKEFIEMNESLFNEWKKHVRKLPDKEIMVSLGADLGIIHFGDRSGHLICIGDAIVWAERMCSASSAGEIYVNNLLSHALETRKDIELTRVSGVTKSGESFQASKIKFI